MKKSFITVVVAILWSLGQSQTFPYVSFMNQTLANHSYMDLSLVGDNVSGSDSVQCHTDLATCCKAYRGPHRGDWYFPNGTRLPFPGGNTITFESRGAERVDLRRRSDSFSQTGIYHCYISTNAVHHSMDSSVRDTVYVGLYHEDQDSEQGSLIIHSIHGALKTAAIFQGI